MSMAAEPDVDGLAARFAADAAAGREPEAQTALIAALGAKPAGDWLACARQLVLRRAAGTARAVMAAAHERFPHDGNITFALSGLERDAGRGDAAAALLRELLSADPAHAAGALTLARLLGDAGRVGAAGDVLRAAFVDHRQPLEIAFRAMDLLDALEREDVARDIAESEIAQGSKDPRIHAYAGMYAVQLGDFGRARERLLFAHAHSPQAPEWNVPYGLAMAQRYRDASHPDFALFAECSGRSDLGDRARMNLAFATGKAHDDIGDYAAAARSFAEANAIARRLAPVSRKQWRRKVAARIAAPPLPLRRAPDADPFTPIFIVGMPRSGTTLVAELLSRLPRVRNRGELGWLWKIAQKLPAAGAPDARQLDALAAEYAAHLVRDDGGDAHWFIDKQPLNLVNIELAMALWPHARIVHMTRNARDNALSLWMQSFIDATYAFASDFADIAAMQQGCDKLMAHWRTRYPDAIRSVAYEALATDPAREIAALAEWIGIPPAEPASADDKPGSINTASLWQARQPVYTRSVGRWRNYAGFIPELLSFPDR